MKKYILVLFLLISIQGMVLSQEGGKEYDVGILSMSLIMPDALEGLGSSELSQLEAKILRMVTSYGLSGNGYRSNFIIYPKFEILSTDEMPGMEKMVSVDAELSLFVKQLDINVMFSSYGKEVKGISTTRSQAIKNAIGKLPTRSKDLQAFMEEAKGRIIAYYNTRCDDIIHEAEAYSKSHQYELAIATLMTIPSEISDCFNKAQEKAVEYYRAFSEQRCAEMLQMAKAAEAGYDWGLALSYLGHIDPSTHCAEESLQLINRIGDKVDAEVKKQWDFLMQQYKDAVFLEKMRINAAVEIAKAYYRRTQPTYHITYKSLF